MATGSSYMAKKKMHLRKRQQAPNGDWVTAPLCSVQNLTTAYRASTDYKETTCLKCIAKQVKVMK